MNILKYIGSVLIVGGSFFAYAIQAVICILAAKKVAELKNQSKNLMWLGLFGWIGLAVTCFVKKTDPAPSADPAADIVE